MAGAGGRSGGLSKATGRGREAKKLFKSQRGRAKALGITGVKAYGR